MQFPICQSSVSNVAHWHVGTSTEAVLTRGPGLRERYILPLPASSSAPLLETSPPPPSRPFTMVQQLPYAGNAAGQALPFDLLCQAVDIVTAREALSPRVGRFGPPPDPPRSPRRRSEKKKQGGKVFVCEFEGCGKVFGRSYNRRAHQRKHNGEQPYRCPVLSCDKRFRWKSSLTSHLKYHQKARQNASSENNSMAESGASNRNLMQVASGNV